MQLQGAPEDGMGTIGIADTGDVVIMDTAGMDTAAYGAPGVGVLVGGHGLRPDYSGQHGAIILGDLIGVGGGGLACITTVLI